MQPIWIPAQTGSERTLLPGSYRAAEAAMMLMPFSANFFDESCQRSGSNLRPDPLLNGVGLRSQHGLGEKRALVVTTLQSSSVSPNPSDYHARRHETHFFDLELNFVALVHGKKITSGSDVFTESFSAILGCDERIAGLRVHPLHRTSHVALTKLGDAAVAQASSGARTPSGRVLAPRSF